MSLFSSLSSFFKLKFPKDSYEKARVWRKIMEYSLWLAIPQIIAAFEYNFLWLIPSCVLLIITGIAMIKSNEHPCYGPRE